MKHKHIASLMLAGMTLVGCGGETEVSTPDLTGGTEAREGVFEGVVRIGGCTGAKIANRTFITAAHCVLNSGSKNSLRASYRPGGTITVTENIRDNDASERLSLTVEQTLVHPSYQLEHAAALSNGIGTRAYDVAIVRVNQNTNDIGVVPVTYDRVDVDEGVYIMGYGCEDGLGGAGPNPPRLKYQYLKTLEKDDLDGSTTYGDKNVIFKHNFLTPGEDFDTNLNASICPGDSGGPVLQYLNGRYRVVGVNAYYSFVGTPDESYTNYHARLSDNFVSWWIHENLNSFSCRDLGTRIYNAVNSNKTLNVTMSGTKIRSNGYLHSSYGATNRKARKVGNNVHIPIKVAFSDRSNFSSSRMDDQEIIINRYGSAKIKLVTWGGGELGMRNLQCDSNLGFSGFTEEGNGTTSVSIGIKY